MKLDILITDTENKLYLRSSTCFATNRLEILRQDPDSSDYTIAYWIKHLDGYDLRFVGRRPFTTDLAAFMTLARIGQDLLEAQNSMDG